MDKPPAWERMIAVGRVLSPRGVRGELNIEALSDSPGRFSAGGVVFLNGERRIIKRSSELSKGRLSLTLEGVDSRPQAQSLRGALLMVPEEMVLPLPEGEYYHFQLADMAVYTSQEEYLGRITQVLSTGANDVYIVSHEGRELLIPALEDVVLEVDVEGGRMRVELPKGLRD